MLALADKFEFSKLSGGLKNSSEPGAVSKQHVTQVSTVLVKKYFKRESETEMKREGALIVLYHPYTAEAFPQFAQDKFSSISFMFCQ